ncbi:DgyrCDS14900 [Dimorphilus gyrociliatus]|uniref:DgyrCDS14900 n=1 Tax=Dimorphilus gyrociliatus TaxID=2664684 RepID=A0A7I8WFB7_9ANNE|nr:DgyrCDS14900 [Dimorphilus gyrociliatus]
MAACCNKHFHGKEKKMKCVLCKYIFHVKCIEGKYCTQCKEINNKEIIIQLNRCKFKKTQQNELNESSAMQMIMPPSQNAPQEEDINDKFTSPKPSDINFSFHFGVYQEHRKADEMVNEEEHIPDFSSEFAVSTEIPETVPDFCNEVEISTENDQASAKGKNVLIHNGYWYTLKCNCGETTYWTCGVRTKKQKCKAAITELNYSYRLSKAEHFHSPVKDIENKLLLKKNVREKGKVNVHQNGRSIAEETLIELNKNESLPSIKSCIEVVNYHERKNRPEEPTGLRFIIKQMFLSQNFLKVDILE